MKVPQKIQGGGNVNIGRELVSAILLDSGHYLVFKCGYQELAGKVLRYWLAKLYSLARQTGLLMVRTHWREDGHQDTRIACIQEHLHEESYRTVPNDHNLWMS